jgi:glycosyltransferase A (GT-A) superfamily protein (DUF2064 family)
VLAETRAKLEAVDGASLELQPVWYDVDRPEDLKFLQTHLQLMADAGQRGGASTRKFLSRLSI